MRILLTLDYELFNGLNSGTVQNCLITPTEELIKIMDKHFFKATFFVDTCFLNRLIQLKDDYQELQHDYELIVSQIKRLYDKGHDIQLHLHPNWFRAEYVNGQWHSCVDDYKLSDLTRDEVRGLFIDGIRILESITGCKGNISCFRAGAYCLQTYTDFSTDFMERNIKIDSSVNRNHSVKTDKYQWYDYTNIPAKYSYRFTDDLTIENEKGKFVEVSIPSYKQSMFSYYFNRVFSRDNINISKVRWGDGTGLPVGELDLYMLRFLKRVKSRLSTRWQVASIDSEAARNLENLCLLEKRRKGDYFMIMGHPKNFMPYSLYYLDQFLKSLPGNDKNVVVSSFASEVK